MCITIRSLVTLNIQFDLCLLLVLNMCLGHPKIFYCIHEDASKAIGDSSKTSLGVSSYASIFDTPWDCNAVSLVSNGPFEFGNLSQNVLLLDDAFQVSRTFIKLECIAPYPIQWIAREFGDERSSTDQNGGQTLELDPLKKVILRIAPYHLQREQVFRCEGTQNSNEASEIFVNRGGDVGLQGNFIFRDYKLRVTYFRVNTSGDQDGESERSMFIVPCIPEESSHLTTKVVLTKRNSFNKTEILYSNAGNYDYRIGFRMNGMPELDSVYTCSTQEDEDIYSTMKISMIPIPSRRRLQAKIVSTGGTSNGSEFGCLSKNGNNSFPLTLKPCDSVIDCQRRWNPFPTDTLPGPKSSVMSYTETLSEVVERLQRVNAFLEASLHNESEQILQETEPHGDDEGTLQGPDSYNWDSGPLGGVQGLQSYEGSDYFEEVNGTSEAVAGGDSQNDLSLGFVQCFGVFEADTRGIDTQESTPASLIYVDEVDYFFKGIDGRQYLLSEAPMSSIITLESDTENSNRSSVIRRFKCKISTFVLLPGIQFIVEYSAGPDIRRETFRQGNQSLPSGSELEATTSDEEKQIAIESLELKLKFSIEMTRVSCFALWHNISGWAKAEMPLEVEDEETVSTSIDKAVLAGGSAAAIFAVGLVLVLSNIWRKYRKALVALRNPSPEEVEEFLLGNPQSKRADGSIEMESLPFPQDMMISSDRLKLEGEILGQGEFGIVHKGLLDEGWVAVKSCKPKSDIEYFKGFLTEIKIMSFIGDHDNIVRFHGAVVDQIQNRSCRAVMELSPFGNLHSYLRKNSSLQSVGTAVASENNSSESDIRVMLNQAILMSFCKQIACGMEFLSAKGVIHGDLATRNVLIFENNVVKINDFGLSRKLYNYANYVKSKKTRLPWRWMAPESLRFFEFSSPSDVWSYGVTIWEIFSFAEVPFSGMKFTTDFVNQIESGLRLPKPRLAVPEVFELMMKCWGNHQFERPTFTDCKAFFINLQATVNHEDNIYSEFVIGIDS